MIAAELRGGKKPNLSDALGWIGSRVDDIYGAAVGRLEDVWIDPGTGQQLQFPLRGVQMLGGVAIADPRHVAQVTTIERAPDGVEEVPVMLARLLSAHESIITEVRDAIEQTAQNGDGGSNDLLIGDVLRTHEQQVWGVAEHLVDTTLLRA